MSKIGFIYLLILVFNTFLFSQKKDDEKWNISIFLDMSSRITNDCKNIKCPEMDSEVIKILAKKLYEKIINKRIIKIDDKIEVYLDPIPTNKESNGILNNLRKEFNKKNITKEKLKELKNDYQTLPPKLYDYALEYSSRKGFIGSDIWRFFKNDVNIKCIEKGYRNILVILTDGYIFHASSQYNKGNKTTWILPNRGSIRKLRKLAANWETEYENGKYGLIVKNKGLEDLEVLVLGINGYGASTFEDDIIERYWSDWFRAMGVNKFEVSEVDIPKNLEKIINRFFGN